MTDNLLFTLAAFIIALTVLIAVHEFGHFWVARRLGVMVTRFSIGFGPTLLSWQRNPETTEYVLAAIPLGGYIKMLDEREGEVPAHQLDRAFNRQPVWKRSAIVFAGPLFNLLFAIIAYWAIFMVGDLGLKPVIGTVAPQSIAANAGFQSGDELLVIGEQPARSWETALFAFAVDALDGADLPVRVRDASNLEQTRWLPGVELAALAEEPDLLNRLGLTAKRPQLPAVIGELVPGEAAEKAGFAVGDHLRTANGQPIELWKDWVTLVREHPGQAIAVEVERRDGSRTTLTVTPQANEVDGKVSGHIGAGVAVPDGLMDDYQVVVRYGAGEALGQAVGKTWDMSVMMLRVMGRMLTGEASVKNLSGPITIAEIAGRTASSGFDAFIKFLAVVSISLGVLNLLPMPVLDGGHLVYFLIERIKGSPVSETIQQHAQTVGFVLLAALMVLAFYADIVRLLD
ncbi:RIP metalloprotease RseP [Chromatium okenii]|uniref:Zinc metalloprotease n=1 Tax=Chromatium okenii TaxID=61644 RepID=A0A2S7XNQ1_9GAMM|nr:RIP metalloprotease RseP [Chromatium okenii]PQJ95369.1 RIP metalloprotease RseP [Chromatium okenii]